MDHTVFHKWLIKQTNSLRHEYPSCAKLIFMWTFGDLGWFHVWSFGDLKTLIFRLGVLVVIQERWLRIHGNSDIWTSFNTHQRHEQTPSKSDVLWRTKRTCSRSTHESFYTILRKHVVPTNSHWTPGCPDPFTTTHPLFLLTSLHFSREESCVCLL